MMQHLASRVLKFVVVQCTCINTGKQYQTGKYSFTVILYTWQVKV